MSVVPLGHFPPTKNFLGGDHHENPIAASKESVIRATCAQIYQHLFDVSNSLSDERLHQTCTMVLHRCEDVIGKPSQEKNDTKSAGAPPKIPPREIPNNSLQAAISQRMANVVENGIIKRRISVGHVNSGSILSALPNFDGQHDVFLNICDSKLLTDRKKTGQNYLKFKRSDSNVLFMVFVHFCAAFFMFTGYGLSKDVDVYRQYPTAILSIIFGFLASFCILWLSINRVVFLSYQNNIVFLQRYHKNVVDFYNSPYEQWPDNGVVLFAALSTGFYLINIVLTNLCDPDVTVEIGKNNHHACDDSFVGPPPESFMLTMITIVVFQIIARGVSRIALVFSWVICFVAINMTLYLSDSSSYAWINLLQLLILWFSYELERQSLRRYIKTLKVIEAGEMAKQLELRLAAYRTMQASDALAAKCSMVRHIGHEIRTPLNVVGVGIDMLLLELASDASILPKGIMEIIEGIKEASNASLEVINELLEFEKLAAGLTTLECAVTPVLPFIEQVMRQHMISSRAKDIQFVLIPSITQNVTINVDPMKLATVFRNLFSNAIKFTKKGGRITVRAEFKSLESDEVVQISVQDSGVGLSPTNLTRLFGEGVQFNANGLQGGGGSGLGLFISKGFVELHKNGKIWAESEGEGKGSTFFVQVALHSIDPVNTSSLTRSGSISARFPTNQVEIVINSSTMAAEPRLSLAIVANQQSQDEPEGKQSELLPPSQAPVVEIAAWKPTILVVDDSAMNRKMLVRMLIAKGFACREAEDGMAGLSELSCMNFRKACSNSGSGSNLRDASPTASLPVKAHMPAGSSPKMTTAKRDSVIAAMSRYKQSVAESLDFHPPQYFKVDAVLIDSNMPRMNGPVAVEEMRKLGFRGPIIGVSGGDEKTLKEFVDAGADNVMQKPAQSEELVNMLLTGLEVVVNKETSRQTLSEGNDGNLSASEIARQEYVTHLCKFLADCKRVAIK